MNPFIFIRTLRNVDHSVFCVEKGQKKYWDRRFDTEVAYSSGQQVKRSILESTLSELNETMSPTTFNYTITESAVKPKQAFSICNPEYTDQILGGWMLAKPKATKSKKKVSDKEDQSDDGTEEDLLSSKSIRRRSPLSISAMRPLHPLLAITMTENLTFDRSGYPATYDNNDKFPRYNL